MLIYEVNLTVDASVRDEFQEWLIPHIQMVLKSPGFMRAEWLSTVEATDQSRSIEWTVRYTVENNDSLQEYFAHHAPHLRADGQARFGGKFAASRRVLSSNREFSRAPV